jgi:hypothetical protein
MFVPFQVLFTMGWAITFFALAIWRGTKAWTSKKGLDWILVAIFLGCSVLGLFGTWSAIFLPK